jgi:tetratricopeptide (TPR) repeat protein
MVRYVIIGFYLLSATTNLSARTAVFEDSSAQVLLRRVVSQTFMMQYLQALSTADSLETLLPGHPAAPLLKAGVLYCRMLDLEDRADQKEFDQYYDLAWERAHHLGEDHLAEQNLYFGVLIGFKSLLAQRGGHWWPAVKLGMKSIGYLEDCLESDPGLADAYLGVGTYKYWRSRATDFINWLPFFPDEKKEGVAQVRRAMNEGLFGREISRSTLAWILIDNGRPSEAVSLSLEGLKNYPDSRFYLWTLGDGYMHSGQWKKAIATFQKLYDSLHPLARNNGYNEVGLCKQISRCYQYLHNPRMALEWVERGLAVPLDLESKERRKKDLGRFLTLRENLQKQLANPNYNPDSTGANQNDNSPDPPSDRLERGGFKD